MKKYILSLIILIAVVHVGGGQVVPKQVQLPEVKTPSSTLFKIVRPGVTRWGSA